MNTLSSKKQHHALLTVTCISHAGLITAAFMFILSHGNSSDSLANFYVDLWWVLFAVWPFWVVVFWRFGWRPLHIVLTIILGLVVLSPVFLALAVGWSLAHGSSLG
jgi:hypothetical protein